MRVYVETRNCRQRRHGVTMSGFGRLARCRRGAVAIELAAVTLPLLLVISGIIEFGIVALNGAILDGAAREASREIRTGRAQQSADPLATFRGRLCSQIDGLFSCERVNFDVRSFANFSGVSVPPLFDADGNLQPASFDPGDAGHVVVVRATVRWRIQTPIVSHIIGETRDMTTSFVFRNEPFRGPQ